MAISDTLNPTMETIRAIQDGCGQMIDQLRELLSKARAETEQAVEAERARCLAIVRCFDPVSDRWNGLPIEPHFAFARMQERIASGWMLDGAVAELTKDQGQ